nr:unnamed protein product [Callosobruchus chinensis]
MEERREKESKKKREKRERKTYHDQRLVLDQSQKMRKKLVLLEYKMYLGFIKYGQISSSVSCFLESGSVIQFNLFV